MKPHHVTLLLFIIGFAFLGGGWAIRSTFVMSSYVNKPLGGIFITGGLVFIIWAAIRSFK